MHVVPKDKSQPLSSVDLQAILAPLFPTPLIEIFHTVMFFDLPDGAPGLLIQVAYYDPAVSNRSQTDAIACLNAETLQPVPTIDGQGAYFYYPEIGTKKGTMKETRYKIQILDCDPYAEGSADCSITPPDKILNPTDATFHSNGIEHFEMDGRQYMAITMYQGEVTVVESPWYYSRAEGGGKIVQRFGSPWRWNDSFYDGEIPFIDGDTRWFGVKPSEHSLRSVQSFTGSNGDLLSSGLHNVFFTKSSVTAGFEGKPTLSTLANQVTEGHSAVYEFVFRPVKEGSPEDPGDDSVFDTGYYVLEMPTSTTKFGGTRPIGDGVHLTMMGVTSQLMVVDKLNKTQAITYPGYPETLQTLYDPFIAVTV